MSLTSLDLTCACALLAADLEADAQLLAALERTPASADLVPGARARVVDKRARLARFEAALLAQHQAEADAYVGAWLGGGGA